MYTTAVYITRRHDMVRTQVYLTERQRDRLVAIGRAERKRQSELIRDAIDLLIDQTGRGWRESVLRKSAGIWKDRRDLPDFGAIRSEWDRCRP